MALNMNTTFTVTIGAKKFWVVTDERGTKLLPYVAGGSDPGPLGLPGDPPPTPPTGAPPAPTGAPPPTLPIVDTLDVPPAPPAPPTGPRTFTETEVEAIRAQERQKLYDRIEAEKAERIAVSDRLKAFETGAQEQQAREAAEAQAAADAAQREAESQLSAAEQFRLERERFEAWKQTQEQERERERLIMQRERELMALESYRNQRMAEIAGTIEPNIIDLVNGNTPEEIEASIASLQERTARIVQAVRDSQEGARRQVPMASPTLGTVVGSPPVGPVDGQPTHQQLTNEDLANMDMETYRANRSRLLQAVSNRVQRVGPYGSQ